jgi:DNA-binding transcriptional ArsR family regulator
MILPNQAPNPDLDKILSALADPTRRQIVHLLAAGPRSAGALGEEFTLSAPALSRHLKVLRQIGIVSAVADSADNRVRVYQLQPQPLSELARWLEQLQGQWQEQQLAFAEHVESASEASSQ